MSGCLLISIDHDCLFILLMWYIGVVCFWDKYKANYPKHTLKWLIVLIAGDEFSARKIWKCVYDCIHL